ncbi:MAG: hypothetical protein Q8K36_04610, partial [Alphaproteobacteria bacterium]|nr:hypothetical protein [Alphaproteobacteria bacterium]
IKLIHSNNPLDKALDFQLMRAAIEMGFYISPRLLVYTIYEAFTCGTKHYLDFIRLCVDRGVPFEGETFEAELKNLDEYVERTSYPRFHNAPETSPKEILRNNIKMLDNTVNNHIKSIIFPEDHTHYDALMEEHHLSNALIYMALIKSWGHLEQGHKPSDAVRDFIRSHPQILKKSS